MLNYTTYSLYRWYGMLLLWACSNTSLQHYCDLSWWTGKSTWTHTPR